MVELKRLSNENGNHNENDILNENDNENEESYRESFPDSVKSSDIEYFDLGPMGYVKLSADEYLNLVRDLGQDELDRVIAYVDESAKMTDNKNGWKDWNTVLRKASRENWGI